MNYRASIVLYLLFFTNIFIHSPLLSMQQKSNSPMTHKPIALMHEEDECCCYACGLLACTCCTGAGTLMSIMQSIPNEVTISSMMWATAFALSCSLGKEFLAAYHDRKEKKE